MSLQILAAGVPIISTIGAGFTTGYSATFLPQLQANSSSIEITPEQGSWIASIAAFAMAPGCLLGGFIMQKYGRKFAHYFLCLPTIIGWLAIYLADSIPPILIGRFLTGECCSCHCLCHMKSETFNSFLVSHSRRIGNGSAGTTRNCVHRRNEVSGNFCILFV